eukprot:symbB.v1.2.000339.t2/scaffold22.1/size431876/7
MTFSPKMSRCDVNDYFILYYEGHGTVLRDPDFQSAHEEAFVLVDPGGKASPATLFLENDFSNLVLDNFKPETRIILMTDAGHEVPVVDVTKEHWHFSRWIRSCDSVPRFVSSDLGIESFGGMEEEVQRLSAKVQEALEEVQHARERVKKMCHQLGQVAEVTTPNVAEGDTHVKAYINKLKTLLSGDQASGQPPVPPEERNERSRQVMSEQNEIFSLEKELQALQEISKPDVGSFPLAPQPTPEGPTAVTPVPSHSDTSAEVEKSNEVTPSAKAKAMAMTACPGRASRSSLPKPPPPKAKATPKAKFRSQASEEDREDVSRLVNLHWRASQAPPEETEISVGKDGYLQCMSNLMERWSMDRADRMRQNIQSFEDRSSVEAERHDSGASSTPVHRRRRKTVFNAINVVPIPEIPQNQLEDFFQAKAATFDIGARSNSTDVGDVTSLIVDSTHQRILDLMVRSEAMQRQRESGNIRNDAVEHAVTELLSTLQSCDFSRLTRSVLNDMRKVVVHHMEGGHNILSFVESRGVEALSKLEHPHLHRLLYGLLRIPSISTRLECMDLVAKFPAETESCREDLQILRNAMLQIRDRAAAFRAFWTMATQLGNTLNGSTVEGFRLSSLSKLMDLKSPERKEMTFFHFVLLQLPSSIVDALTDPELMDALKQANNKRTHTVHQDVVVHLDGFRRLEGLVATGSFKGESIPSISGEDPFHQAVADFVGASQKPCAELWALSLQVFQSYRDLGIYFNDLSYVYPPPGSVGEEDRRKDLFSILCNFVVDCSKARQEIDGSKDGPTLGLGLQVLDAGFTAPYLSAEAPVPPVDAPPATPRAVSPEGRATGGAAPVNTPEATPRVSKFNCDPLSPVDLLSASPNRLGPLVPLVTPTGPPPSRSLKGKRCHSPSLSMPSVPPPKRGPSQTFPLPGTPTLLTSPTTPGKNTQCRSPVQEQQCRQQRKSLANCAHKAVVQALGASAARVRGESDASPLGTLLFSSSASRSSFRTTLSHLVAHGQGY